jgi:hypothetical protein
MRSLAILLLLVAAGHARADPVSSDERRAWWGLGVGVATALVPAAVGASLYSAGDDFQSKHAGVYLLCGGLALAPVASHLIAREYGRALLFGALPLASMAGMVGLVESHPDVLFEGDVPRRVLFAVLISVDVLASTIGLADSLGGPDRARARRRRAAFGVVPTVGAHTAGLSLGGVF